MFRILESQPEGQSVDIKRYVAYRYKEKNGWRSLLHGI